jgi:hypothetical protein
VKRKNLVEIRSEKSNVSRETNHKPKEEVPTHLKKKGSGSRVFEYWMRERERERESRVKASSVQFHVLTYTCMNHFSYIQITKGIILFLGASFFTSSLFQHPPKFSKLKREIVIPPFQNECRFRCLHTY